MSNILYINACVRANSRTDILAREVLKCLNGTVCEVNLEKEDIKPLNAAALERRKNLADENDFSAADFKYARQFADADLIVIAAPYWDLSFPALLKAYLEAVSVCDITFRYGELGVVQGLCNAKRLIYVTTAGGTIGEYNFGFDYVKTLAKMMYGIDEVTFFSAENLDIIGADVDAIMENAREEIKARLN